MTVLNYHPVALAYHGAHGGFGLFRRMLDGLPRICAPQSFEVLLIGPYPPPFGGVSVHIKRLTGLLEASGVRVGVLDHFARSRPTPPVVGALKRNPMRYALTLPRYRASVTHYHHGGRLTPLLAAAMVLSNARHGRTIVTVHGHDLEPFLESHVPFVCRATRWALARFDLVIAVSEEIATRLQMHLPENDIRVLPAYLPPAMGDPVARPVDSYSGGAALVVAAYDVVPFADGDLYGIDVAFGVFRRLAEDYPSLRLVVFLAKTPSRAARRYLRSRCRSLATDVRKRASIRVGDDLTEILGKGVIYLRPTRRDGDAVSIREALAFGAPTVASDIVQRPDGTRLVRGHNLAQWTDAIAEVLRQRSASDGPYATKSPIQGADDIVATVLNLYAGNILPAQES